jgi:NAD-dependent DNA ligase
MNIASIGEATLDMLVDQHIITSISDIYTLTQPETIFLLKRFPGIGSKKVDTFVAEVIASKSNPLRRLLNALGINGVGIKLAKEIEKQLTQHLVSLRGTKQSIALSITKIFQLITQAVFLENIYGIGGKIIIELQSRHQDPKNQLLLQQLQSYDVKPTLGDKNKALRTHAK